MSAKINPRCHIGEIHGIYEIVDVLDQKDKYGHWIYKSVCTECGHEKFSHYGVISGEKSKATVCTHLRADGSPIPYDYIWENKRLASIFQGMVSRCYNTKDKNYRWYGEKGIKICDEWLNNPMKFQAWAIDNDYCDDLTIDRKDANKNYSPDNCQWIPLEENSRKGGMVNWITVDDITLTGRQWSEKLNLGINTINKAIRERGIDLTIKLIAAMLKEPPSTKYRKSQQTWFSVYGIQQ